MANETFEIGLVGAGAISAGAYTGGVVDFMVHALDRWYEAKGGKEDVPPHDVKISVFSGASAGGITAALAAGYLGSDQPPIADENDARANRGKNKLFESWVERIDIASLLESRDLPDKHSPVPSLLDSSVLTEIADSGLDIQPRAQRRPYLAENFELLLTVTNLRGVPYAFKVMGSQSSSYDMSLHADYMHFRINDSGQNGLPDRHTLSWRDFGEADHPCKAKLKLAALASGAFPLGLAPRTLREPFPPDPYSARLWSIPTPASANPHQCVTAAPIAANWGQLPPAFEYAFRCVDGGVMNNEPLELARAILAGGPDKRNERDGNKADKAVLLIDPFPSQNSFNPAEKVEEADLLELVLGLFGALKNQARFKPDELMLAGDDVTYSRFMIAPTRGGEIYPIACGALGGFGGFLKRDFRAHDFFLGRRNAQKFLKDHFVLPENNPLFNGWDDPMRERYCVRDPAYQPVTVKGQRLLPIIPLVGEAANKDCFKPSWPRYEADDLEKLLDRVSSRVDKVVDRLVEKYFKPNNLFVRYIAKLIIGRKKEDVVQMVRQRVSGELRKMRLMT